MNLKKTLLFIILTVTGISNLKSQNFEGKISYKSEYSNIKIEGVTSSMLKQAMGSIEDFYIQSGNHLTQTNGTIMDWVVYRANEDKIYFKMKDEKEIHYKNSKLFDKKLYKIEFYNEDFDVLGYNCKKIIIHFSDKTKITSYYAPELPIEPNLFENDKYDGLYLLLSNTKAISLKTIYESAEYTKTIIAAEIRIEKLPENTFELPSGLIIIKAPW
jgi:hypothetical protein